MARIQHRSNRTVDRRTFLKKSGLALVGFLGLCAVPFYSYYRERFWLETVRVELEFADLPDSFDGMRVVHFSDVHYGFYYEKEPFAQLINTISSIQPDLILYTGDLFDGPVLPYAEECVRILSRLAAPLGKFAVPGNHDYYTGRTLAMRAYRESGFQLLINRSVDIRRDGGSIAIVGLDDMLLGRPDMNAAFSGLDSSRFTLLLAHEPDLADRTSAYRADLQLSGHSHGGQIRLPLIGDVLTPAGGRKYVQGLYELKNRDVRSFVYTTRGVGTTHVPIRLLCRPELTVLTLRTRRR